MAYSWLLVYISLVSIGLSSAETISNEILFTLPKQFGNYSWDDLSTTASCGSVMATYNGIPAKSNGQYQGTGNSCGGYGTTGSNYQCVEYTQRYFYEKHGTAPIWYANAKDMCSTHPTGVSKTTSPKAGDAVVFGWGSYGHTAIVSSVSGGLVHVTEQNASPTGTNAYSTSDVECYLTAGGSSGSCPGLGYYCGNDGLGKDANTLYYCSGAGATPSAKSCSFTCVTMPKGQDDVCSTSGTCKNVNTGYYCGSDKVSGEAHTLYYCVSSSPNGAKYCSNGCHTAASGSDDYCS
eukprot:gene15977-21683_t